MTDYSSRICRIHKKPCDKWSEVAGCGFYHCPYSKKVEEEPKKEKTELKPCPFCGEKADYSQSVNMGGWKVLCERCGGQTRFFRTPEQAIEAWNRRADITCGTCYMCGRGCSADAEDKPCEHYRRAGDGK